MAATERPLEGAVTSSKGGGGAPSINFMLEGALVHTRASSFWSSRHTVLPDPGSAAQYRHHLMASLPAPPAEGTPSYGPVFGSEDTDEKGMLIPWKIWQIAGKCLVNDAHQMLNLMNVIRTLETHFCLIGFFNSISNSFTPIKCLKSEINTKQKNSN